MVSPSPRDRATLSIRCASDRSITGHSHRHLARYTAKVTSADESIAALSQLE